jgi:hypothetical protein
MGSSADSTRPALLSVVRTPSHSLFICFDLPTSPALNTDRYFICLWAYFHCLCGNFSGSYQGRKLTLPRSIFVHLSGRSPCWRCSNRADLARVTPWSCPLPRHPGVPSFGSAPHPGSSRPFPARQGHSPRGRRSLEVTRPGPSADHQLVGSGVPHGTLGPGLVWPCLLE